MSYGYANIRSNLLPRNPMVSNDHSIMKLGAVGWCCKEIGLLVNNLVCENPKEVPGYGGFAFGIRRNSWSDELHRVIIVLRGER